LGDVSFPSTIPDFPNAVAFLRGLWRVIVQGASLRVRPESWYWHPTRIIPSEAGNPITEFPAFTFLYGDLHAHMIAFPLTLFALSLAVNWAKVASPVWSSVLIGGLVIGALRPTNTWDYPTYLVLGIVGLGLGAWRWRNQDEAESGIASEATELESPPEGHRLISLGLESVVSWVFPLAWRAGMLVGLTMLLYLPFIRHYVSGYTSFQVWEGQTTPVKIYLWIHGMLLFPVVTRVVMEMIERVRRGAVSRLAIGLAVAGALALTVFLDLLKYGVALVAVPVGLSAGLLFLTAGEPEARDPRERGRFVWLMVGTAMVLSLAVEVIVLEGDIGRMNTVFKFYLQVWILLALAAAVSLAWIWTRAKEWRLEVRRIWWIAMGLLALGGALFLPLGIRARAVDRMAPEVGNTLDGMAFMCHAEVLGGPQGDARPISLTGDYYAVRWMQENIEGSPPILEGLGWREYLWGNRVSVYTGLPAVVGWRHHQAQQRVGVGGEMVNWRREDVNECYSTADISRTEEILEQYGVRYVYVGEYERAYYGGQALAKFDRMAERELLRLVYDARGVTIYEVLS
jgi:YYY domain-containing protein